MCMLYFKLTKNIYSPKILYVENMNKSGMWLIIKKRIYDKLRKMTLLYEYVPAGWFWKLSEDSLWEGLYQIISNQEHYEQLIWVPLSFLEKGFWNTEKLHELCFLVTRQLISNNFLKYAYSQEKYKNLLNKIISTTCTTDY